MVSTQKDLFRWADQIPAASWRNLQERSPQHAAEAVGAVWDGYAFKVPLIGTDYLIDPAHQRITKACDEDRPASYQAGMVLLTTLSESKGVPPSGRMTVPQELPGGRMFFTGAHSIATEVVAKAFESEPSRLIERTLGLGGQQIKGADVAFRVPGLPYVPLYILLWRDDSKTSTRAIIGIDDRAHFHLDLAGVLAMTNLLVYRLCKAFRLQSDGE